MKHSVTIVGGGLAGMIAALRLRQNGYGVTILEAGGRLGGKAGADKVGPDSDEHGWHLFPLWYVNTWALVDELGIRSSFVDRARYAYMEPGKYPQTRYLDTPFAFRTILHNTFRGVLPAEYSVLYQYTLIDLLSQPIRRRAQLDQVTVNGFARSRFYTTERVVDQLEDTVSRASAIESYEMSAMTVRNVTRYWLKHNDPWFRILNTDLQSGFIAPFEKALRDLGVEIELATRVEALRCDTSGRIDSLSVRKSGSDETAEMPVETVILAVPQEVLRVLLSPDVVEHAPHLTGAFYLRSRAMAGMTIYFKSTISGIPSDHVNFIGSPYDLSMIDVTQVWQQPRTVLCVVASDYTPLQTFPPGIAKEKLLSDLARYLPFLRGEDIERIDLQPHVDQPLFMNTAGAWPRRPKATTDISNLFMAGDYCQSRIDLTCMEGAVTAGLLAAEAVRTRDGARQPLTILEPQTHPRLLFVALKILLFPAVLVALTVHAFRRLFSRSNPV